MWALFVESLFRSKKGSAKDLANSIGVARQTLYNLRSGRDQPRWETIGLLANYQGMEPEDLVAYVKSIG